VGLPTDELLAHIATLLRTDIGPAVSEPFAKTQTFMAAVILEKLAAQLRADEHPGVSPSDEAKSVVQGLEVDAAGAETPRLRAALHALRSDPTDMRWSALVRALYAERDGLGEARFQILLARVRQALRTRLDRLLVYAA
jgi:hypothetical protein